MHILLYALRGGAYVHQPCYYVPSHTIYIVFGLTKSFLIVTENYTLPPLQVRTGQCALYITVTNTTK